ncbi:CD9 antigen isoform X1 [Etheostoma spectabile]|uniref:CD9 antigen isoform X1 n=1 Tax=Etheostoma spectabile TaxID=54343 RepID=UPI0013AF213D|nr:CD9 antigen-like isoform X1 [Etheostoma spectabile]
MALDGCGLFCKYTLFIFNLIFALLGFAFLGLGLWLRFSESTRGIFQIEDLNSSAFVIAVTVLIALGSVMLIVVVFGDYGACNEKRCALQVFSVLLTILAIAEIAIGVVAYSSKEEVGPRIVEFYSSLYALYLNSGDPVIGATLTFIHKMLHCCGVTGVVVLELVKHTCPKADGFWEQIKQPNCPAEILGAFNSNAPLVMGIFVGTGVLLIIALICSTTLSRKIRQSLSSPQYIILTHSTSVMANPHPSQCEFVSSSYPDQDPVFFTPLSMANIPVAQS